MLGDVGARPSLGTVGLQCTWLALLILPQPLFLSASPSPSP